MKRYLKFIAVGLVFALFVEFIYRFIGRFNPKAFGIALLFYPFYLTFAYTISRIADRVIKSPLWANVFCFIFFGFFGLMVEWKLLGNSPSGNPNASQIGMFAMWTVFSCMPRLFTDPEAPANIKKVVTRFFTANAVITIPVALMLSQPQRFIWSIYSQVVAYVVTMLFLFWYFKILADSTSGSAIQAKKMAG